MKFATVCGACLSYRRHVTRPMLVSSTAVGPVGSTGAAVCEPGESGRSGVALFGVALFGAELFGAELFGAELAGGACCGGGVCWAEATLTERARAIASRRAEVMR